MSVRRKVISYTRLSFARFMIEPYTARQPQKCQKILQVNTSDNHSIWLNLGLWQLILCSVQ